MTAGSSISKPELKAVERVLAGLVGEDGVQCARQLVKNKTATWQSDTRVGHAWALTPSPDAFDIEMPIAFAVVWLNSKSGVVSDQFDRMSQK